MRHPAACLLIGLSACAGTDDDAHDTLELPAHATPEEGADAGPIDAGPSASCAGDDGCDPTCALLDRDCPDGAGCGADALCTAGCHERDPDCVQLDDGARCTFGEECASARCFFVDDVQVCSRRCDDDSDCTTGMRCEPTSDPDPLCVPAPPASCAAGCSGMSGLALPWLCLRRARSRTSTSIPAR